MLSFSLKRGYKMQQQKLKFVNGRNEFEKHARRLVHCIFAPFVVLPQYVDDKVPEGMKTQIIIERFSHLGKEVKVLKEREL